MKLRIRGDSLRIRVSQAELSQIAEAGSAADVIRFDAKTSLRYGLQVAPCAALAARFEGSEITVMLPERALERWLEPEEVSISGEQSLPDGRALQILIEKDFTCLKPREGEDDSDLFPNPALSAR